MNKYREEYNKKNSVVKHYSDFDNIDYIRHLESKLEQAEKEKGELVDMNDKDYKELQSEIVKTIRKLQQLETGIKELKEEMNLLDLQLNAKRYLNK